MSKRNETHASQSTSYASPESRHLDAPHIISVRRMCLDTSHISCRTTCPEDGDLPEDCPCPSVCSEEVETPICESWRKLGAICVSDGAQWQVNGWISLNG